MARNRNVFTRLGRPPKMTPPKPTTLASGERQGQTPMAALDTAIPASAFRRGGQMPKYHDDPAFLKGGSTRRR